MLLEIWIALAVTVIAVEPAQRLITKIHNWQHRRAANRAHLAAMEDSDDD